jgi:hypothetical protein
MQEYAFVEDFTTNITVIQHKLLLSSTKVRLFQICLAKKAHQYTENSLYHMIDIFLCPEMDLYYSAIEGRPKAFHP